MSDVNRRKFLGTVIKTASMVAGASLLDIGLLRTVAASPVDGKIEIKIDDHDELKAVGGAVVLDVGPDVASGGKIIIARSAENVFSVIAAKCTHKGCTIGFNGDEKRFDCPCHGSQYNLDGSVLHGPAPRPLQSFKAEFADRVVTISYGPSVVPADSTHK